MQIRTLKGGLLSTLGLLVEDFDSSSKDTSIFNASAKGQIEFKFNSNSEQLKMQLKKVKMP